MNHFSGLFIEGLFRWREEDPSDRKIQEDGSTYRHMFSVFSLHVKKTYVTLALASS